MTKFSIVLEKWYEQNGRYDLPWRKVTDPYLIWISEIILQQTRVAQGYEYYQRFINRFPDVFALASADEDEVLKLWQGLGYYSRARNLHSSAQTIAQLGNFPTTYEEVRKLKGIGDYTASAICSFAYHQPYAVVDGNVFRVLSRIFGIDTPIDSNNGKKVFASLANDLLDKDKPHLFNSAIMDFGALQCTPKSPFCNTCPFADTCFARMNHTVPHYPVKGKKTAVVNRFFVYIYIQTEHQLLLHRRGKGDIWQGLYEPYLFEFEKEPSAEEIITKFTSKFPSGGHIRIVARGMIHLLTHRRLWISCYTLTLDCLPVLDGFLMVNKEERHHYATPKIITTLFSMIDDNQS